MGGWPCVGVCHVQRWWHPAHGRHACATTQYRRTVLHPAVNSRWVAKERRARLCRACRSVQYAAFDRASAHVLGMLHDEKDTHLLAGGWDRAARWGSTLPRPMKTITFTVAPGPCHRLRCSRLIKPHAALCTWRPFWCVLDRHPCTSPHVVHKRSASERHRVVSARAAAQRTFSCSV